MLISGGPIQSKVALLAATELLVKRGYQIYATQGTHRFFAENNVPSSLLFWPDDAQEPNVLTYLKEKKIDLVINIPKNLSKGELDNDYKIRRTAVDSRGWVADEYPAGQGVYSGVLHVGDVGFED